MKEIIMCLIIFLFMLSVITYPLKMVCAIHVDVVNMIGFAVVSVYSFKLLNIKCEMTKGKIKITKKHKRKKKNDKSFSKCYLKNLVNKLEIKKMDLFFDAGEVDNVKLVSILCGSISSIFAILISVLLNKFQDMKVFKCINPHYDKQIFELSGRLVLNFTLIDVVLSFISALKEKYERSFRYGKAKSN